MQTVVLLRGLGTSGADDVKIGAFSLGNFYFHWEKELQKRNIAYLKLDRLGKGTIKDSYHVALNSLREELKKNNRTQFHFLTHSSGGIIARKLTYEGDLQGHIRSLTTVACPHRGSSLVELAEKWAKKAHIRTALRVMGYDLDQRLDHLRELSEEKMADFNSFYPALKSLRQLNVPCSLPAAQRSWVFDFLRPFLRQDSPGGDGLLSLQEQEWREVEPWGPCALDHLSSLGYFLHLQPVHRALAQREFHRLFDHVSSLWQTFR